MNLGELQPPGEDRNQVRCSLASMLACLSGTVVRRDFPRGRYLIRGADEEQVREAVVSCSVPWSWVLHLPCFHRSGGSKYKKNQDLEDRVAKEQDLESGMETHKPVSLVIPVSASTA